MGPENTRNAGNMHSNYHVFINIKYLQNVLLYQFYKFDLYVPDTNISIIIVLNLWLKLDPNYNFLLIQR